MFCQDILRIGCSVNVVTNDVFAPVVTQATLTKSNFAILVLSDASKLDNALHQVSGISYIVLTFYNNILFSMKSGVTFKPGSFG